MSLGRFPQPWRPNAIYQIGDRITIRDEHRVYVLRCESPGKGGVRPPKLPKTLITRFAESHQRTAVVKLYDADCEWWLERVVRRTLRGYASRALKVEMEISG